MYIHRKGRYTSTEDKLDIATRRERLRRKVDSFNNKAAQYLEGVLDTTDVTTTRSRVADEILSDDEDDDPFGEPAQDECEIKDEILFLPSTFGEEPCRAAGLTTPLEKEIGLRQGQANDALQQLRQTIGQKSFLYRENLRKAEGKIHQTRAWTTIKIIDDNLTMTRLTYAAARRALISLGAENEAEPIYYRQVTKADMRVGTIILNPNAAGQRNARLAWFWTVDMELDADNSKLMKECKHHRMPSSFSSQC